MYFQKIDLGQTHIRLKTDLEKHGLERYIYNIRQDLKSYILKNPDFRLSLEPVKIDGENQDLIVKTMYESSLIADTGPMACVAGSISELSVRYLIGLGTKFSIVENGGDIALLNDEKVVCGIYSNNEILGNRIAFEIKPRKKPLGICTSSGRIGHSISFGDADSVTVIADSSSIADGLATRIANSACGESSEIRVANALEMAENYREFFRGILVISDESIGTAGRLPKIVETPEFDVNV